MKKLIFASIFALFTSNLFAQNQTHTVGMSASSISGAGFSYKYKINEDWTTKSSAFLLGDKNSDGTDLNYNLGSEIQFNLFTTKKSRLYILTGGSYWYSKDEYQDIIYGDKGIIESSEAKKRIDEDFHLGIALGIEAITFDNISINFDFGYHYLNSLSDADYEIGFGGGIGIGYTFGK